MQGGGGGGKEMRESNDNGDSLGRCLCIHRTLLLLLYGIVFFNGRVGIRRIIVLLSLAFQFIVVAIRRCPITRRAVVVGIRRIAKGHTNRLGLDAKLLHFIDEAKIGEGRGDFRLIGRERILILLV
ncbi:hypothetical protein PFISCL1PPCAC_27086, partial [Pristionchus fissidentatus]